VFVFSKTGGIMSLIQTGRQAGFLWSYEHAFRSKTASKTTE
jgi:hypothetical protein